MEAIIIEYVDKQTNINDKILSVDNVKKIIIENTNNQININDNILYIDNAEKNNYRRY